MVSVPGPYKRIYTFADVVTLRTLATLRRTHGVPLDELRRTAGRLSERDDGDMWHRSLWVLDRRVFFEDPCRDAVLDRTGQVAMVEIAEIRPRTERDAAEWRRRYPATHGQLTRHRYVMHNA